MMKAMLYIICVTGYTALLLYDFRLAGLAMTVIALFVVGLSRTDGYRTGFHSGFKDGGRHMLSIVEKEMESRDDKA